MASGFLSYSHEAPRDGSLAHVLVDALDRAGHTVFIDEKLVVGGDWRDEIEAALERADFFIVLLSHESVASEWVYQETVRAHKLRAERGTPMILPVRVDFADPLPMHFAVLLDGLSYAMWQGNDGQLVSELTEAVNGATLPNRAVSEPLRLATSANDILGARPLPEFDARWLERMELPGGAMRADSPFYIRREADLAVERVMRNDGITLCVKGGRQMGKTSLLSRAFRQAAGSNRAAAYVHFQGLDDTAFRDADSLFREIAEQVAWKLQVPTTPEEFWSPRHGPKMRLTEFLKRGVLENCSNSIVLMFDEVDRLLRFQDAGMELFSLLRSWHDSRPFDATLARLSLILAYSTEASMFILELNQSPFNVATIVEVQDFDHLQTAELSRRHGSPVGADAIGQIDMLLHGHPYLVRKLLYDLTTSPQPFEGYLRTAHRDDGPFGDHLRYCAWKVHSSAALWDEMQRVVHGEPCLNDEAFYRLRAIGMVRGASPAAAVPRCELYRRYFSGER